MGTSSSHISWGHGDKALISNSMLSHGMGHGAKSLTSTGMLPHYVHEEPSTLGLSQWRTTSPPRVAAHTVRFQCKP